MTENQLVFMLAYQLYIACLSDQEVAYRVFEGSFSLEQCVRRVRRDVELCPFITITSRQ